MRVRSCWFSIVMVSLSCFVMACSNAKRLPAGKRLFVGSQTAIADKEAPKNVRKALAKDMLTVARPKPNTTLLGVRLKLTLYNMAGPPKRKRGIRQWVRRKVGEPPVLADDVSIENNKALMVNLLQNRGFFHASATGHLDTNRKKKAHAVYEVSSGPQYTIKSATFRKDTTRIMHDIADAFDKTLLAAGAPYSLDLIKAERVRIDRDLKEKGYFYFRPEYIIVVADTSVGEHKVNLTVRVKRREIPDEAYHVYTINDVYVFTNYKLSGKQQDSGIADNKQIDNYHIIDHKSSYNPRVFTDALIFEKGDRYSLDDQNASLSRLVNMGNFKFVKNRFEPVADSLLDVYYYLTPYPRKSLRFEAGALTQNDNRAGAKGSVSWRRRNAFKGAEELAFKLNGGMEMQYGGVVNQPNFYNLGSELSLSIPRFAVPFVRINTSSRYLPHTKLNVKYNFESSAGLLRINSYSATYGYNWREGLHKEHDLRPLLFTYVKTDTLGNPGSLKPMYGNLIFNGIILGSAYDFTYNTQSGPAGKNAFFFNGRIDVAGNILGLSEQANFDGNPRILFGSSYAQYILLQPDFRYYRQLSFSGMLAARVMAGIGIPYGNSATLPNVKQFWAGGNSDLRGFPSRLVGPGTFDMYDNPLAKKYIQTLGDLKLQLNLEYRQRIYQFLNAALFADAGNIWLYRDNTDYPGGKLTSSFYKELAVDAGIGIRLDFKILLLRFDLGLPIRKPWLAENSRWVLQSIDFGDTNWRRTNLIFNIAIGYPF